MLQTLRWTFGSTTVMDRCRERYGDVFTLDLVAKAVAGPGAMPNEGKWVFLSDPEDVRTVFTADPRIVLTGETNRFLEPVVGARSILVLDEPDHMTQRRLMLPHFHGDRVQAYGAVISEVAGAEVDRWPVGEPFALWPRMQAITLEVIVRVVFGMSGDPRALRMRALLRRMLDGMTSRGFLVSQALAAAFARDGPEYRPRSTRSLLTPVEDAILDEVRRRRLAADLEERGDILSLLMLARYDDGGSMGDGELRDELMTLLIAGHESTATMLAWAFERLVRHPQKLSRLRDEAEAGQDEYAEAVVRETLRLRPVLPIVLRKLAGPLEIGGYRLPAGTWLAPCAYLIQRRADIYPEPLEFRPERFLDSQPGTYTWMPFGGGVRRCLGAAFAQLEMKLVLQSVAARADLCPASPDPERVRPRFITLAPSDGARVVVSGRRDTAPPLPVPDEAGVAA